MSVAKIVVEFGAGEVESALYAVAADVLSRHATKRDQLKSTISPPDSIMVAVSVSSKALLDHLEQQARSKMGDRPLGTVDRQFDGPNAVIKFGHIGKC
jgi:hypothetical protein